MACQDERGFSIRFKVSYNPTSEKALSAPYMLDLSSLGYLMPLVTLFHVESTLPLALEASQKRPQAVEKCLD
jgi:hypothetical protein